MNHPAPSKEHRLLHFPDYEPEAKHNVLVAVLLLLPVSVPIWAGIIYAILHLLRWIR